MNIRATQSWEVTLEPGDMTRYKFVITYAAEGVWWVIDKTHRNLTRIGGWQIELVTQKLPIPNRSAYYEWAAKLIQKHEIDAILADAAKRMNRFTAVAVLVAIGNIVQKIQKEHE